MKEIHVVCLECGKKHDRKHKEIMGVWIGDCDMCGAKQVSCAAAGHDFGIYNTPEEKTIDKVQDVI